MNWKEFSVALLLILSLLLLAIRVISCAEVTECMRGRYATKMECVELRQPF